MLLCVVAGVLLASYLILGPARTFLWTSADDLVRFMPAYSIDIAMAMGLARHDTPIITHPAPPVPELLTYPPTAEDLERLSG